MDFEAPKEQHLITAGHLQRLNTALRRHSGTGRSMVLCITVTLLAGCVTTNNNCGNESRDWHNLSFPKEKYCSVPANLPFAKQYEQANRAVCKVHDNNSGIWSNVSQSTADHRFLCDYIKRSEFPWGVRHVTGYLSYFALRAVSLNRADPTKKPDSDSEPTQTTTPDAKPVDEKLRDFNNKPVLDSQGTAINIGN